MTAARVESMALPRASRLAVASSTVKSRIARGFARKRRHRDPVRLADRSLEAVLEPAAPRLPGRDEEDLGGGESRERVPDRRQRIVRPDLAARADPASLEGVEHAVQALAGRIAVGRLGFRDEVERRRQHRRDDEHLGVGIDRTVEHGLAERLACAVRIDDHEQAKPVQPSAGGFTTNTATHSIATRYPATGRAITSRYDG